MLSSLMDEDEIYSDIANRLRAQRDRIGWTQARLADAAGLPRSAIANIEGGRQRIAVHHLLRISAAIGVAPSELLPETNIQEHNAPVLIAEEDNLNEAQKIEILKVIEETSRGRRIRNAE